MQLLTWIEQTRLATAVAGSFWVYPTVFQRAERLGPGDDAPPAAKAIGAISLFLWVGVIFFGRMVGF